MLRVVLPLLFVILCIPLIHCQDNTTETPCRNALDHFTTFPNSQLMTDSCGRGLFGVFVALQGLIDPGKYRQCVALNNDTNTVSQYCLLKDNITISRPIKISLPSVLGLCAPSICSEAELTNMTYLELAAAFSLPVLSDFIDSRRSVSVECKQVTDATTGTIVVASILGVLVLFILVCTLVDAFFRSNFLASFLSEASYSSMRVQFEAIDPVTEQQQQQDEVLGYGSGFSSEETNRLLSDDTRSIQTYQSSPRSSQKTPKLLLAIRGSITGIPDVIQGGPNEIFKAPTSHMVMCYMVKFCMCWSIIYNTKQLLAIPPSTPSTTRFSFIHGLKVAAMLWAILGYTIYYLTILGWFNIVELQETETDFSYQLYANSAVYTADMFLMFSGLLIVHNALTVMRKRTVERVIKETVAPIGEFSRFVNIILFVARRIIRLWPSILFAVFFFWYVSWMFGDGPFMPYYQSLVQENCSDYWWSTSFFLSSLYPKYILSLYHPFGANDCMSWTWIISVDMICFLCTPILLFVFYKRKLAGMLTTCFLIVATIITGLCICYFMNLSVGLGQQETPNDDGTDQFFNLYYSKPYTRAPPYLLGVLMAFAISVRPKMKIPIFIRTIAYAIVWPMIFVLFFITYSAWQNGGWSDVENSIFAGVHHPLFSLCFSVIVYFMSLGYSGPLSLRHFFSATFWIPFSRLSLGTFIYAPVIMIATNYSSQIVFSYTAFNIIYRFIGMAVVAYLAGYLNYILIERPFANTFDFFALLLLRKKY